MLAIPESTLIRAVKRSDKRLLEVILPKCIQFGARDGSGKTALMIAAEMNHRYFCQLLAEKEHQFVTEDGKNALMLAVQANATYVIPVLAQHCAYVKDASGHCALSYAALKGSVPMCELVNKNCHLGPADYERALGFLRALEEHSEEQRQTEAFLEFILAAHRPQSQPQPRASAPAASFTSSASLDLQSDSQKEGSEGTDRDSIDITFNPGVIVTKRSSVLPRTSGRFQLDSSRFASGGSIRATSIGSYSSGKPVPDASKAMDQILGKIELEKLQAENSRLKSAIATMTIEHKEKVAQMQQKIDECEQAMRNLEASTSLMTSMLDKEAGCPSQVVAQIAELKETIQKKDQEIAILRKLAEDTILIKAFDAKLLHLSNKLEEATKRNGLVASHSDMSSNISASCAEAAKFTLSECASNIDEGTKLGDTGDATILIGSTSSQKAGSSLGQTARISMLPLMNELQAKVKQQDVLVDHYRNIANQQAILLNTLQHGDVGGTDSAQAITNNLQRLVSLRTEAMERAMHLVEEKDASLQAVMQEQAGVLRQNVELQAVLSTRRRSLVHTKLRDLLQQYDMSMADLETARFRAVIEDLHGQVLLLSDSLRTEKQKFESYEEAHNKQLDLYYGEQQKNIMLNDRISELTQSNAALTADLDKLHHQYLALNAQLGVTPISQVLATNQPQPLTTLKEADKSPANTVASSALPALNADSQSSANTSTVEMCESCIELGRELSQLKAELKRVKNMYETITKRNVLLLQDLEKVIHTINPECNVRRAYAMGKQSNSATIIATPPEIDAVKKRLDQIMLENPPLSVRMEWPVTSKLLRKSQGGDQEVMEKEVQDMWTQTFNLAIPLTIEDETTYNIPTHSPAYELLPKSALVRRPFITTDKIKGASSHSLTNITMLHLNVNSMDQSIQLNDTDMQSVISDGGIIGNIMQPTVIQTTDAEDAAKSIDPDLESKLDERLGLVKKNTNSPLLLTGRMPGLLDNSSEAPPPPLLSAYPPTTALVRRNLIRREDTKKDAKPVKQIKSKSRERRESVDDQRRSVSSSQLTPLMAAVLNQNLTEVRANLQYTKVAASTGMTALMLAVESNFIEAVKVLAPLEANISTAKEETALLHALRRGNLEAAAILTPYEGTRIQRVNLANDRFTELMRAAKHNNLIRVWALLGYQKKMQDENKRTALMYAADAGNYEVCRLLAPHEAGMTDNTGDTALMMAVINQNMDIVELLLPLEFGRRGHKLTNVGKGYTALQLAVYYGNLPLVQMLYPAEFNLVDDDGRSCLDYATHCSSRVRRETRDAIYTYLVAENQTNVVRTSNKE